MSIRVYEFVVGPETTTLPTVSNPSSDDDFFSFGFAEDTYAHVEFWGDGVQSNSALKAITPANRNDKQVRRVDDDNTWFYFDAASAEADDGSTILIPDDSPANGRWKTTAGGAGGGAGAPEISNVVFGEPFLASDVPCGAYLEVKPVIDITSTSNKVDFNEGAGDLLATLDVSKYRWDNSYERQKLLSDIDAKMTAAGTGFYTSSFNPIDRKITISSTVAFTLKNNTGSNAGESAPVLKLGWSGAADTSSATSHEADNAVTTDSALLALKTDACYPGRSSAYQGVVESAAAQWGTGSIKKHTTIPNFTGLTEGDELFTAKGCIKVEAGVSDDINFNEGAGERSGQVAASEYFWDGTESYGGLSEAIKDAMETAPSAVGTYDVKYDNDTDKFTISRTDGGPDTFSLPFATGTDQATSVHPLLGFNDTDLGLQTSHTAQNELSLRGDLLPSSSPRVIGASVEAGFAQTSSTVHAKRLEGRAYAEVINEPGQWLTTPQNQVFSNDVVITDQYEDPATGRGVRLVSDDLTSPAVTATHRIQYKTSASGIWQDSATTIPANEGLNWTYTTQRFTLTTGVNGDLKNLVMLDPDNPLRGVIVVHRLHSAGYINPYFWYTNDGGVTWTVGAGGDTNNALVYGASSWVGCDIDMRDSRCLITVTNRSTSGIRMYVIADTGSGYTALTYSDTTSVGTLGGSQLVTRGFIQYFPGEATEQTRYRYVAVYNQFTVEARAEYWNGDLTTQTQLTNIFAGAGQNICKYAARDMYSADKNRLVFIQGDNNDAGGGIGMTSCYSNIDYAGGVLTLTAGSEFTGGLIVQGEHNPSAAAAGADYFVTRRALVVVRDKAYIIATLGTIVNDPSRKSYVYKCDDVTTNTWSLVSTPGTAAAREGGHVVYLSGKNILVFAWKESSNHTNSNTEGQIWAQVASIDGNSVTFLGSPQQVDGGQPIAGYQGHHQLSGHAEGATLAWLRDTGTDNLYWNKFQ